ncbi:YkgJ family cysteine cluster protein [Labilibaculum sp.]|uniref:YkgJ family cysteine cluster protein n=1 Tax=Labilibaculum sp. TaxID=2060723 RepID=UPI002AA75F65|nr:YkgJ family cysteine cluster protein [Labilibaculum sp.]
MQTNKLSIQNILPLTCARIGACCHGNQVLLNPWELMCLAREKKIAPREFRDLYCEFGGIRLHFNGKAAWGEKQACSQYVDDFGCSVHLGRPLACRLYPLGRQIQNNEVHYMFQGDKFPCLEKCPEVINLPQMSVGEYLNGQITDQFEKAQDQYLEIMQNIADIAFELLLDTGLAESGDKETLPLWRKMGNELPEVLAERIGQEWIDCLMIPEISDEDPIAFTQKHNDLLQLKAQKQFGTLQTNQELHEASVLMMGVALHFARGIGADPKILAEHWIGIAKNHGAQE